MYYFDLLLYMILVLWSFASPESQMTNRQYVLLFVLCFLSFYYYYFPPLQFTMSDGCLTAEAIPYLCNVEIPSTSDYSPVVKIVKLKKVKKNHGHGSFCGAGKQAHSSTIGQRVSRSCRFGKCFVYSFCQICT